MAVPQHEPANLPLETNALRRFVRQLDGRPRMVIQALLRADGEVRDDELRTVLGFDTNYQLAGTMAGLSKRAERLGIGYETMITKTVLEDGVGRHYTYRLTDAMRAALAH